jgi:hypothetical protein
MPTENRVLRRFCFIAAGTISMTVCLSGCSSGLLGGASSSGSGTAPQAVSSGPQLGYIWNTTDKTLRPVLGVPGSSQIGQSVTPAGLYVTGAASARSSIALLEEADGSLVSMPLPSGSPTRIVGGLDSAAQIVFSPSGTNAIVFSPAATSLMLVTALNTTPQAQPLSVTLPLLNATVGDRQQVAVATGSGPVTLSLLAEGKTATLTSISQLGAFNFVTGSDDLLFTDTAKSALSILHNVSTSPTQQDVSVPAATGVVAVASSRDGLWAVMANAQGVVRIDLTSANTPLNITCGCQPNQLAVLDGNAVFQITSLASGPTWIVDASAATPQTLFIPAVKP